MSYGTTNILGKRAREKEVMSVLKLLDYNYLGLWRQGGNEKVRSFHWYKSENYESWTGVELSLSGQKGELIATTRTAVSRSYYDLEHQNKTIKFLKKHFGGEIYTDYGKNRFLNLSGSPSEPDASGCYIAFNNFGNNLIRLSLYIRDRDFGHNKDSSSGIFWLDRMNPRFLSNNLILPFLVSILEDYWKSTYIALLKYSHKKESVLKGSRISSDRLIQISANESTVEQAFAEGLSFARISIVCKHFRALDLGIDLASILRKPYRRRKKTLFDSLEEMTEIRNAIIHEASSPILLEEKYIEDSMRIVHDSIERFYKALTNKKDWKFEKYWSAGLG